MRVADPSLAASSVAGGMQTETNDEPGRVGTLRLTGSRQGEMWHPLSIPATSFLALQLSWKDGRKADARLTGV